MQPSFVIQEQLIDDINQIKPSSLKKLDKNIIRSHSAESFIKVLKFFAARGVLTDEEVETHADSYQRNDMSAFQCKVVELYPSCFERDPQSHAQYVGICNALNISTNLKAQYKFLLVLSLLKKMITKSDEVKKEHLSKISELRDKRNKIAYCNLLCGLTTFFGIYCAITGVIILIVFGIIAGVNYQSYKFCPPEKNGTFMNYTKEIAIEEACTKRVCRKVGTQTHCRYVLTTCTIYLCQEIATFINTTLVNGTAVNMPYPINRTTARGAENGQAYWPAIWGVVGSSAWILLSLCIIPAIVYACNIATQKSRRAYYDHKIAAAQEELDCNETENSELKELLGLLSNIHLLSDYQSAHTISSVRQPMVTGGWGAQQIVTFGAPVRFAPLYPAPAVYVPPVVEYVPAQTSGYTYYGC